MKKVLFSATVLKGHILKFHIPYMKWFKENGFEVWVIANNDSDDKNIVIPYCDYYIDLPFSRNPLSLSNFKAYQKIKKIIDKEKFTIIHTHTPIGGVLTRLAAKMSRKKGTKVVYTAHGFHFFNGAPLLNWFIYYPIEKMCSKITDVLITINNEDYQLAKTKFNMQKLYLVNGVGIDFSTRDNKEYDIRNKLNLKADDFILVSIGELNKNKNHKIVIDALLSKELKDNNIKYIIVGEGKLFDFYDKYIKDNNLSDKVFLLGFRSEIFSILKNSNLFIFPSKREGLPVSIMEAMHCGLPCIVSNIRGNKDLIENGINGYLCSKDLNEYKNLINKLYSKKELLKKIGKENIIKSEKYTIENVIKEYIIIYKNLLEEKI